MKILSVFDSKVQAYSTPFFMRTRAEALRGWQEVVNDPSTAFNKHPEDYTLFELGEFNEDTGAIKPLETPNPIGKAIEYKINKE